MIRPRAYILFIIGAWVACVHAAQPFHTPRLSQIAQAVGLAVPEGIGAEANVELGPYNGRVLRIRTNRFGDVSHIGYKLFGDSLIAMNRASPVFDFMERYLLELDLGLDGKTREQRMDADKVVLVKGSLSMLAALTPADGFAVEEIVRRMYRITWTLSDRREVTLTFPASVQLFVGANAIELELMMERDVQRMLPIAGDALISDWSTAQVSRAGDLTVVERGAFLSDMIRGDLYLTERRGKRQLLCDRKSPSRSVSNIMLTGQYAEEIPLRLMLNRYGRQVDTLQVTLQQYVNYCLAEGCKLYFGIKTTDVGRLTGTLFAMNEAMAYDHVLSVDFPLGILDGSHEAVTATAYVYIPLQNVTEKFFYQGLKDENR